MESFENSCHAAVTMKSQMAPRENPMSIDLKL